MRTFKITLVDKWIPIQLDYIQAGSHNKAAILLPEKSTRIKNERFRDIETTGRYYMVSENIKGGQTHIFEIC